MQDISGGNDWKGMPDEIASAVNPFWPDVTCFILSLKPRATRGSLQSFKTQKLLKLSWALGETIKQKFRISSEGF